MYEWIFEAVAKVLNYREKMSSTDPKTITVKIQLADDIENVIALNFPDNFSVGDLKNDVSEKFNILSENLLVSQGGEDFCNEHLLNELQLNDFGIVEITLKLKEAAIEHGVKLDTSVYYSNFTLPDIITVHVPIEDENGEKITKDLVVEIENKTIKKPFLGGFVHTKTKIEYHHAFTQTGPTLDKIQKIKDEKCSRDTQTVDFRQCSTETSRDESTQYFRDANDVMYQSIDSDTILMANKHFDSQDDIQMRRNVEQKVRLIQRNFRLLRLKKCLRDCAAEYRRIISIKKKHEERIKQDYINSNRKNSNFPRTKKDFDVLFAQIATWKESETKRIAQEFSGPTRVIEMQSLLEKEIQFLNGIETRRLEIQDEIRAARQDRILRQCGEPVKWIGYNNALVEMDTLSTQRARKLTEFFCLLRQPMKNLDDRLRLLNDISEALSNENTSRIIELENLFQRERELLKCKVSEDALKVLRKRQIVVFMDVIKDNSKSKKSACHICEKCKSVLPLKSFAMHSKQKSFDLCKNCASLKSSKTDLSVYRAILRAIQRDERKRGSFSSFAFIIQETDVRHIIENIWHNMSVLSQCNVTSDLRLCRWNVYEEWSPWNCICLTDTEAQIHVKCSNLEAIYGEKIVAECRARHSLAKSTYKHLKKVDDNFVESGDWHACGIKDKIV